MTIYIQEHQIFDTIRAGYETDLVGIKEQIDAMIVSCLQGKAYREYVEQNDTDDGFIAPDITDADIAGWYKQHYRQLRREYILRHIPQHEQNEAIVEYYGGDDMKMRELARVKSKAKELFPS